MTAGSLDQAELTAVARLASAGLSRPAATLAVILVTREHARPAEELPDVIRQYQHLDDRVAAHEAVAELRGRQWIEETASYGRLLVHGATNLRDLIADCVGDPTLAEELKSMRAVHDEWLRILGPMSDREVYGSYIDLLREAQSVIRLPMLATTPHLSSAPILRERAQRGVRVAILLGAPEVVKHYRGGAMQSMAVEAIRGWTAHANGIRTMEVRVCHDPHDLLIATCMSVDDRILRFDIYDPDRHRSLQGVMLEIHSPGPIVHNIHRLFVRYFDTAWRRAEPTARFRRLAWWFGRYWQYYAAIPCAAVSAAQKGSGTLGAVTASLAAAFLFSGFVETGSRWRNRW